ncbi:MAG: HEAT repeat domain-containing protein [Acidobacteria bacterium]|nr:HEAT repeat domain-containing protein [Acidobacteriota bacterium]
MSLSVALPFVAAGTTTRAQAAQRALTPVAREIERERARLNSSETEERRDAVTMLGAMARPDASRAAAAGLTDAAPIVRATAARAVLSLPPDEAARLVVPLLRDKSEFVRREAAYALGLTRSRVGVGDLIPLVARDKEAGVRGAAAVALGQIGDARAVPALSGALGRRVGASGILNRVTFRKCARAARRPRRARSLPVGDRVRGAAQDRSRQRHTPRAEVRQVTLSSVNFLRKWRQVGTACGSGRVLLSLILRAGAYVTHTRPLPQAVLTKLAKKDRRLSGQPPVLSL